MKIDEALISALKRRDCKDMFTMILEDHGFMEEANAVKNATRITPAFIERVISPIMESETVESSGDDAKDYAAKQISKFKKFMKKGKMKKAKKVLEELKDFGHDVTSLENEFKFENEFNQNDNK